MGAKCTRATDPNEEDSGSAEGQSDSRSECRKDHMHGLEHLLVQLQDNGRASGRYGVALCLACRTKCTRPISKMAGVALTRSEAQELACPEELDVVCRGVRAMANTALDSSSHSMSSAAGSLEFKADPHAEVSVVLVSGCTRQAAGSGTAAVPRVLQPPSVASSEPVQVRLNIYDVGTCPQMQLVNACLGTLGAGLFHCGVEVYANEWSYAATTGASSGVFSSQPRKCELQTFHESVWMGTTRFTRKGMEQLIHVLEVAWPAAEYNILTHNCYHFCNELCQRLGVGPIPPQATNLAAASACMVKTWDTFCCRAVAEAGLACKGTLQP
mmetsp:Transcript_17881/g.54307  ORF Transcript_17881/g.54307 Transcript_17881/m.54307 type:complete len:327 (+) Transcript_17881:65-1045(+)